MFKQLQSENAKLREELSAFDLTFFEEIEQLKVFSLWIRLGGYLLMHCAHLTRN
eukprot:m.345685 g.345685  ORF g.345685 m.345685 type:complete len:54 (-) comp16141_c1_seq13:4039-4200(-)